MKKYCGVLDAWHETGSEGLIWVLWEKRGRSVNYTKPPVDLKAGDHLKVYGEDGSVIFNGKIVPDYKAGLKPYPGNPKYGQPCVFGLWVHWTQRGWKSEDWAMLFVRGGFFLPRKKRLRAELTRSKKKKK